MSPESRPWYLGAVGELEVARLLDQLGSGWHVVHAVPVGTAGSDIDHIVVGPAGVFTINAKYHEGQKVWVASKRILVGGHRTDHIRNAQHEGSRAAKLLNAAMRRPISVTPIIAIVAARQITYKEAPRNVAVLRSTELVRWLERRPIVLTPEEVEQLARAVREPHTWGDPTLTDPDLPAFASLRAEVTSARRTRRRWALGSLALPFAMIAFLPMGIAILQSIVTALLR